MFDSALFLAFPLTESYEKELSRLSPFERNEFIRVFSNEHAFDHSSCLCLQQIESDGKRYLGKFLGSSVEMEGLDLSSIHLFSILKKLVPQFPYEQHPLVLLALQITT